MLPSYQIVVRRPTGEVLYPIEDAIRVTWGLKENKPGAASLTLPSKFCGTPGWSLKDFGEDFLIDIWEDAWGQKRLIGDCSFMIQELYSTRNEDGRRTIQLECDDGKALLSRRLNSFHSQHALQDYLDNNTNLGPPCSTILQSVFNRTFGPLESFYGDGPDPARQLSPTWIQLGTVTGASTVLGAFEVTAHKSVLAIWNQVIDYAASQNEPIFWNVTTNNVLGTVPPNLFFVNIWVGLRGTDRRSTVILTDYDSIANYRVGLNFREALRKVACGGKGSGSGQSIGKATSPDYALAFTVNPFAAREGYITGPTNLQEELIALAQAELQRKLARYTVIGNIRDTETYKYRRDYNFGDWITVQVEDQTHEVYIDTESGVLENGTSTITVGFNSSANGYNSSPLSVSEANPALFSLNRRLRILDERTKYFETLFGV